ncbi:LysR family transcriptional regulator [Kordiimonas sediminis]|uniref:LysR family transcriptional regulator n=1 Tax=Kordiimonas sediminis TaxID=1735581 RepID=A0A919AK31_9PROT|nr:hydrogen peroxide-inducible genes activator [Kordiimonas sediminis]GHF11326.1 LysR family transcriptional regulator [Kordiimonas sediminis]
MNFPPTFKQLKYLVMLHKTLHFGKAAEMSHVTQSTLSAGIQELENLLGLQLVERTKRSVMFTDIGNKIVSRAQNILNEIEDLTDLAATAKNPLFGTLRMGIIPTIAPFLLPRIMPALGKSLPNLEFHLREDKSQTLCDMMRAGELDVILFALPFDCGDVSEMPLFEDPFYAAFPLGANAPEHLTSSRLDKERLLLLEEGHCLRDHALSACRLVGKNAREELSGTSLHTIIQMVANGAGVTLLPGMAVDAGITAGVDVKIVPFEGISPTRTIGLVWRKSSPRAETFKAVGNCIKDVMEPN